MVIDLMAIFGVFSTWFTCILLLITAHIFVEFPLQGDFLMINKNPKGQPLQGIDNVLPPNEKWWVYMFMHSWMQAVGVLCVTGMTSLFLIQLVAHFMIDSRRCEGIFDAKRENIIYIVLIVIYATVYTIHQFKDLANFIK